MEETEMADKQTSNLIDTAEALTAKLEAMRQAQRTFAAFSQEQVDRIFFEAAKAANMQRIPLAKMAVEETGMGVVEDKVIKNHYAAEYIYNAYKNMKTCGVIEEDKAFGFKKIAEPVGLIAAVIPTTNPTSTAIFKALIALKTRNAIIFSPHPRAKACTIEAARIVLDAAVKAGSAMDVEVQPLERYDLNAITGMVNVIEERDITEVILGMHRRQGRCA